MTKKTLFKIAVASMFFGIAHFAFGSVVSSLDHLTISGMDPDHNANEESVSSVVLHAGSATFTTPQSRITIAPFPLPADVFHNRKLTLVIWDIYLPTGLHQRLEVKENGRLLMEVVPRFHGGSVGAGAFQLLPGTVSDRVWSGSYHHADVKIVSQNGTKILVEPGQMVDLIGKDGIWHFLLVDAWAVPGTTLDISPGAVLPGTEIAPFSADYILFRK